MLKPAIRRGYATRTAAAFAVRCRMMDLTETDLKTELHRLIQATKDTPPPCLE